MCACVVVLFHASYRHARDAASAQPHLSEIQFRRARARGSERANIAPNPGRARVARSRGILTSAIASAQSADARVGPGLAQGMKFNFVSQPRHIRSAWRCHLDPIVTAAHTHTHSGTGFAPAKQRHQRRAHTQNLHEGARFASHRADYSARAPLT